MTEHPLLLSFERERLPSVWCNGIVCLNHMHEEKASSNNNVFPSNRPFGSGIFLSFLLWTAKEFLHTLYTVRLQQGK
jgi:hypothetical protein